MSAKTVALYDGGDPFAPVGTLPWARAAHLTAMEALNDATVKREHAQNWIDALREDNHFRLLQDEKGNNFLLWEDYCTTRQPIGLGYSPDAIDAIIAERESVVARAEKAKPEDLPRQEIGKGKPGPGRPKQAVEGEHPVLPVEEPKSAGKTTDDVSRFNYGNGADYITTRIARDHPDTLEKMKQGAYPSVRAAAKAVGLVKPEIRCVAKPENVVSALVKHLSPEDLGEVYRQLGDILSKPHGT